MPSSTHTPQPLALVIFTNRLTALIEQGFSLVKTFTLLEDSPEPYGSDAIRLREAVQAASTLSEAMSTRPDLYSPYYVFMVRAGEIGGILEVTLRRAADIISKEWHLMSRWKQHETEIFLAAPSSRRLPESWDALSPYQRTAIQLLFCDTWGAILGAGVPILRSMEVVRWLLPSEQALLLDEAREAVANGQRMSPARLGMLPAFVSAMIDNGEETGTLNSALVKVAKTLEAELDTWATIEER
ncbi:MAG: type II secretion system F family protein [Capsulimonadaceae bacterium]|nr:type II secretion system F family protein [Capsulimonadaceae bacterium]